MGTVQRPEITIKVYPENLVNDNKLQILKKLKTTNALILNLTEKLPKNKPYPFTAIVKSGYRDCKLLNIVINIS